MMDFFKSNAAYICLGIPGFFYLGQAAYYGMQQGKIGMSVAFVAYSVANVGFILDSKGI